MKTKLTRILTAFALGMSVAMPAFAGAAGPADLANAGPVIMDIVLFVFGLVAPILIFFGAYKIALGFGGNKPEEQTKGVQMAVAGVMVTAIVTAANLIPPDATNINVAGGYTDLEAWINGLRGLIAALGSVLVTYGLIKFAIAFQNDDAGARLKAYQQVITGAILAFIGTVVNGMMVPGGGAFNSGGIAINNIGVDTLLMGACTFIGGAMVLFGAINLAQAFSKEDADAKVVGTRWMVAGVLIIAIGNAATALLF